MNSHAPNDSQEMIEKEKIMRQLQANMLNKNIRKIPSSGEKCNIIKEMKAMSKRLWDGA